MLLSNIETLLFDKDGLIPAIVQDARTKQVLMLAYMNLESLAITLEEKRTCFYSRSRQELWRKGETSGNFQTVLSLTADCDSDSLLVEVVPAGPACHTGSTSCYYTEILPDESEKRQRASVEELYQLILSRKAQMLEGSYTTYLFKEGIDKILKKVGEEATEVVIAAKNNSAEELIYEVSDLVYHTLVLLAQQGVSVEDIRRELAQRHKKE